MRNNILNIWVRRSFALNPKVLELYPSELFWTTSAIVNDIRDSNLQLSPSWHDVRQPIASARTGLNTELNFHGIDIW